MFSPKRVALIGASAKEGSVGRALLTNLMEAFPGELYPVNPKHAEILSRKAYRDLAALPARPDLAVIATPSASVPHVIRDCAQAGVRAAIIISAGFKECGSRGAELEREVLAAAREAKIRLLGPNCLGAMIPHSGFNATFASKLAAPGPVAFLSQSGALCTAVLDWSLREKVGFSAFVSVGSMLDVGWGDLIAYFGQDPHTKSIVCYMESVGDARSFLSAAREIARNKPIIVIKVGRTDAAAKAAASHTGSLTGSDAVLDAAFRRVGVLRVNAIEELFDMAEVLAKQPRPRGPRLAIVTNAGGPAALATDALILSGGHLAELSVETRASLDQWLPPHWSHGNPIDILGDASAEQYGKAVQLAVQDPGADGVLVILTPQAMTNATATAEALRDAAQASEKPILASWMGDPAVAAGETILNAASIPTFKYPDRAARAFAFMWRYADNLRALYETPTLALANSRQQRSLSLANKSEDKPALLPPEPKRTAKKACEKIIANARRAGRTLLTELESKEILSAYGIPIVETRFAATEDEAVQCANEMGFPLALKLHSETITHKSDVGGVQLDLNSVEAVRAAWRAIHRNVATRAGAEHFRGVTVQRMVPRHGCELIFGSSIDAQFGPILLFGSGGRLVEVFKDRALGLPPLNATLARRVMEQTLVYQALHGVRGEKPVDLAALEQLLVRFSQLVAEQRWIAEIDINPLLASADRFVALDARVVLHPSNLREDQLPRLAIRPYPETYVAHCKLRDGTDATIRPIRPEDEPLMVAFHHKLSEQSIYFRYFTQLKLDERIAHERLSRLCFIDYDREMALVAERQSPNGEGPEILGVGRLAKLFGADTAEFALIVGDAWQGQGLGTHLLNMLVRIARDEKLKSVSGAILPDNRHMLHVAQKTGFKIHRTPGASECFAELDLSS